jgi:hypothetical protein
MYFVILEFMEFGEMREREIVKGVMRLVNPCNMREVENGE